MFVLEEHCLQGTSNVSNCYRQAAKQTRRVKQAGEDLKRQWFHSILYEGADLINVSISLLASFPIRVLG